MLSLLDIAERSQKGPKMEERAWDMALFRKLGDLAKKSALQYPSAHSFVNLDDSLPPRAFEAAGEFLATTGVYCASTGRVIPFTEQEVRQAAREAPSQVHVGEGRDQRMITQKKVEGIEPINHNAGHHAPWSEELAPLVVKNFAQIPSVDYLEGFNFAVVDGREIVGAPLEAYAARRQVAWLREGIRKAGRPGMAIAATLAGCLVYHTSFVFAGVSSTRHTTAKTIVSREPNLLRGSSVVFQALDRYSNAICFFSPSAASGPGTRSALLEGGMAAIPCAVNGANLGHARQYRTRMNAAQDPLMKEWVVGVADAVLRTRLTRPGANRILRRLYTFVEGKPVEQGVEHIRLLRPRESQSQPRLPPYPPHPEGGVCAARVGDEPVIERPGVFGRVPGSRVRRRSTVSVRAAAMSRTLRSGDTPLCRKRCSPEGPPGEDGASERQRRLFESGGDLPCRSDGASPQRLA